MGLSAGRDRCIAVRAFGRAAGGLAVLQHARDRGCAVGRRSHSLAERSPTALPFKDEVEFIQSKIAELGERERWLLLCA